MSTTTENTAIAIKDLAALGTHIGFSKSRRHPKMAKYIYESKNKLDIFDLDKTITSLSHALEFLRTEKQKGSGLIIVGGKSEAATVVKTLAEAAEIPYVASRWIGGTLTNFALIRKRVEEMLSLQNQREKGELAKYTKKERLLIDRKIEKLERMYSGIRNMTAMPKVMFLVDHRFEGNAHREAVRLGIKTVSLCSSDNDASAVDYPIPANDSNVDNIRFFTEKVIEAYK